MLNCYKLRQFVKNSCLNYIERENVGQMKKYLWGLLVFSCVSYANNVVVYRWVDANNVVHYSQHQPEHDNYTTLTMSAQKKSVVKSTKSEPTNKAESTTSASSPTSNSVVSVTIEQRCQDAKNNIETLSAFEQVQYTDANGEVHILSKEEKNQQLLLSQKQVEIYCN